MVFTRKIDDDLHEGAMRMRIEVTPFKCLKGRASNETIDHKSLALINTYHSDAGSK